MAEVILSARMQALTDMVTPGNRVADVGCDHGFVSIWLVQTGKCPRALAMDVRSGPLSRAREHVRDYGLEKYIDTRLSDGLDAYAIGEADSLICAGMGGRLMERILTEGREKAATLSELILQPQSDIPAFRVFLRREGYELLDENILYEEGKYYFLMKVRPKEAGTDKVLEEQPDRQLYDQYGELLLRRRDPVLQQYLQETLRSRRQIVAMLQQNADGERERTGQRLFELEGEIQSLCRALALYETKTR